jgi:hypothetical protein
MAEKKDPPYFMYFPGNYRWSAAFINMLGSAPYGGSDIGELHKIGTLLKGKAPEDDEAWFDACVKVADGVRVYADRFDKGGHRPAASHAYLRACNYYQMAERFRTPKDRKALDAFKDGVDCFHRFPMSESRSSKCRSRTAAFPATSFTRKTSSRSARRAWSFSTGST